MIFNTRSTCLQNRLKGHYWTLGYHEKHCVCSDSGDIRVFQVNKRPSGTASAGCPSRLQCAPRVSLACALPACLALTQAVRGIAGEAYEALGDEPDLSSFIVVTPCLPSAVTPLYFAPFRKVTQSVTTVLFHLPLEMFKSVPS